jgi:hypothetical protein
VSIFGGLLLVATFFMPYIIFTVPLGGLPVNLPVAQLDDVVLALSGMQIIQAAFNVNSLLAGLLVGLPDFVQDAVEPLIEPLLSDIRAHIVWFVLPPISSLLVGIWYILVGGVAAMGLLSGKRVLLTLVRIISFTGSVLVVVALASAYMQRMNILDVSNVFVSLAAGFWVMLVGVLVATAGILFIRAGSSSSI